MRGDALQIYDTSCDSRALDSRTAPAEAGAALVGYKPGLEGKFAGELHDARVAVTGDLAEVRPLGYSYGLDVGMVGGVEGLRAELEFHPVPDAEVAIDAKVNFAESRTLNCSAALIARHRGVGARIWRRERARVEPQCVIALVMDRHVVAGIGVANHVWAQAGVGIAQYAEAGVVGRVAGAGFVVIDAGRAAREIIGPNGEAAGRGRQRQAAVGRVDAGDLPSAERSSDQSFLIPEPRLFQHAVNGHHLGAVHRGAAIFLFDVVNVLWEARSGVVRLSVGQVARPGIVCVDVGPAFEALGQLDLHRVVVGIEDRPQRVH